MVAGFVATASLPSGPGSRLLLPLCPLLLAVWLVEGVGVDTSDDDADTDTSEVDDDGVVDWAGLLTGARPTQAEFC